MLIFNKKKYYVFSFNFHLSTLFQHFGGQYIKFIVTYCNTKRGKRNIWLLLIVSTNLHQIKKIAAFPKTENFIGIITRNVWRQSLCYIQNRLVRWLVRPLPKSNASQIHASGSRTESEKPRQRVSNADRKVFANPECFCNKPIIG